MTGIYFCEWVHLVAHRNFHYKEQRMSISAFPLNEYISSHWNYNENKQRVSISFLWMRISISLIVVAMGETCGWVYLFLWMSISSFTLAFQWTITLGENRFCWYLFCSLKPQWGKQWMIIFIFVGEYTFLIDISMGDKTMDDCIFLVDVFFSHCNFKEKEQWMMISFCWWIDFHWT